MTMAVGGSGRKAQASLCLAIIFLASIIYMCMSKQFLVPGGLSAGCAQVSVSDPQTLGADYDESEGPWELTMMSLRAPKPAKRSSKRYKFVLGCVM